MSSFGNILNRKYKLKFNISLVFFLSFFQDGLKAVESLKPSIETLSTDLYTVSNNLSHLCCELRFFTVEL